MRRFYTTAQEILADPHNPYPALARRLVTTVDTNTVKMVGLNLGYSSLVYGAAKLKRRQRGISTTPALASDPGLAGDRLAV